ncbi:MAG: BAR domain-containing protein [Candidatus Hermodarchaeota archaeon]
MFKKLTDALGITSNKISELIKESKQYIDAIENVTKEIKKTIAALKSYAETETPSLGQAVGSLASTFEIIEKESTEKVKRLQEEYITPLNELLISLEKLQTEQRESQKAMKDLEKAEKHLSKVQSKPKEKLKPNEMQTAETELKVAKEKLAKEEADVKVAAEDFNKIKLETMQKILKNMVDIENIFHKKILDSITNVEAKADAIKVEEESKI